MSLRGTVMKSLPSTMHPMAQTLQWLGLEARLPGSPLAMNGANDTGGWLASAFLALLICLAIVAFCWMQRRERILEQYAEEESRMRNTIAEAQASIDEQVDAQIAAASAASGSSFAATAAALPRPSNGNALNQPLPPKPKVSLPGCGPLPGSEASASRMSFAATARRSSFQRRSTDEYMLGETSFMTVASAAPRDPAQDQASSRASTTSTRKSVASAATRKSVAELAEARKSLVEVMQMYGPDEEAADIKVNRTSLSGWYADEKGKPDNEAAAARERSLSSWYASEEERRVSVDPAKVVSLKEDSGGEVTVPSAVAHNLTEEASAAGASEEPTAQSAAQ